MAQPQPVQQQAAASNGQAYMSYDELMSDPVNNPFVNPSMCYENVFSGMRLHPGMPTNPEVLQSLLADFSEELIGGLGYMVSDGDSITGILKVAHGLQHPGRPGYRDPDRHQVFAYEGEVPASISPLSWLT